jgi:hypothetical protein
MDPSSNLLEEQAALAYNRLSLPAPVQAPAANLAFDVYESIRVLLDLPPDYILVGDMDCVHRRKGKLSNTHGHLYIFNKCVAFYSKVMKAIVINYVKVTAIKKSSKISDRIKGKIKIQVDDGTTYSFKRLKNRDHTYETLLRLWQETSSAAPHLSQSAPRVESSQNLPMVPPAEFATP